MPPGNATSPATAISTRTGTRLTTRGVIVIVTLSGEAEFTVLESRDPPVTLDRWTTSGGDVVLLRGADLGALGARCPLHQVGTPTSGRFTMTLRHNEHGYVSWPTP